MMLDNISMLYHNVKYGASWEATQVLNNVCVEYFKWRKAKRTSNPAHGRDLKDDDKDLK